MRRLEGRVAIITGGATGIGRATALRFAADGADLVLATSRNLEGLGRVAEEVRRAGRQAVAVRADVSVDADVQAMVRAALDAFGRLDVLVNNAGSAQPLSAVHDLAEDVWERVLAVDLKSVYLGARHAIPVMLASGRGGAIVNVSSVNSVVHVPGLPAYTAAKGGIDALTRQMALEYGPRGIRVNAVNPGLIAVESVRAGYDRDPEGARVSAECYPLGRVGEPGEVATAIAFLASAEASFITGVTLLVDGGLSLQSVAAVVRPDLRGRWRSGAFVFHPDRPAEAGG